MSVTIKQIAEHAGLSWPTVSRVLNDRQGHFSAQTRRRVLEAAQALGYRPNTAARTVRTGRLGSVGLLASVDRRRRYTPVELLEGIQDALAERDYHLTHTKLPDEKLTDQGYVPKILREHLSDGLLINYTHAMPARMRELIEQYKIPSVWINADVDHDSVRPDDFGASRALTEHLIGLGHRDIVYLSFTQTGHHSEAGRREGCAQAMVDAGLSPRQAHLNVRGRIDIESDPASDDRCARAMAWLEQSPRPTAIVAYSPLVAETLLYAAARLGVRVPEELSIATIGDSASSGLGVAITTQVLPWAAIGRTAVSMLMKKIGAPSQRLEPKVLPTTLVTGHTTAAPRR